ncbi:MAG: hypothetical protein J6X75_00865 [Clostridia bacterium]|nr:hypothetical protein [Clostridia bacterium]
MKNPYDILGMPDDSDFNALEKRYNDLRKKYGEQRFKEGEEGNEGARKLNELEVAWAQIKSTYENENGETKIAGDYELVEKYIKSAKYDEAQSCLDSISERNAKWHYYQSIIYYKRDWLSESRAQLIIATQLEPNNKKYRESLEKMDAVMNFNNTKREDIGRNQQYGSGPYEAQGGEYDYNQQQYRGNGQMRDSGNFCADCLCQYLLCETCCTCMRCMGR